MSVTEVTSGKVRRTQQERRAATRQALLDAMLACLLEDGYAGLTTRRVAERAAVSAATQRFYFPNRSAFVATAVEQLAIELLRQQHEHPARSAPAEERFQAWIDALWEICNGPAFLAMMELSCVARTDEDARDHFATAERAMTRQVALSAADLFPHDIHNPRFRALIELATASMRGLAMFRPVTEAEDLERRWRAMREELICGHRALIRDLRPKESP